ncbi:unnamed protein product [Cylindrotheca closterium]|uniref:Uncharacterized protein n=1 Tax=Cylindrotheca closterium TaxID=2856 RepID=A0AAD2JKN6_9STRA|nr:unnamed protein product [Cylindrotheca closterium]
MMRLVILVALISAVIAFAPAHVNRVKNTQNPSPKLFETSGESNRSQEEEEANEYDPKREQEIILESMSLDGAKVIANMDIPERAKRAMLAEAVEDRIFSLTEKLESLIDEDGMITEQNRGKAVEIAEATKSLQTQYQNLVSGEESSILQALSAMGKE